MVKHLRIGGFLVLAIAALTVSITAQRFHYYDANDLTGPGFRAITVDIAETKGVFVVTGAYVANNKSCDIKGVYTPVGRKITGTCVYGIQTGVYQVQEVKLWGSKLADKDELEITVSDDKIIAYRDGNKPKETGGCTVAGTWKQTTPTIGTTNWVITADGKASEKGIGYAEGTATLKAGTLHIDWHTGTGYSGYYEWTLEADCSSGAGVLAFKTGRTDTLKSTVEKIAK